MDFGVLPVHWHMLGYLQSGNKASEQDRLCFLLVYLVRRGEALPSCWLILLLQNCCCLRSKLCAFSLRSSVFTYFSSFFFFFNLRREESTKERSQNKKWSIFLLLFYIQRQRKGSESWLLYLRELYANLEVHFRKPFSAQPLLSA